MSIKSAFVCLSCLVLAACGGEGSSPPPASGGTPPATPTPTPPPTHSSSIVPISYEEGFEYESLFAIAATSTEYSLDGRVHVESRNHGWADDPVIGFEPSPEAASWAGPGGSLDFGAAERLTTSPMRIYMGQGERAGYSYSLGHHEGAGALRYVSLAWLKQPATPAPDRGGETRQTVTAAFGAISDDTRSLTSTLRYDATAYIGGGTTFTSSRLSARAATVSVAAGSDGVSGTIVLSRVENGAEREHARLQLKGTLSTGTNRISGTIVDASTGYAGTFEGALFGPERNEIALALLFSRDGDAADYHGFYLAPQN
ncbi:hypothetical protein WJS89_08500 [Sphingomicrobium sp. XHP0235]|uniref:hypothetical protein n=1 Tax=Sphingomicrobium aquimarinum TaxID=3133971 RepID=UPI0031FF02C3